MYQAARVPGVVLKGVVFDDTDLASALGVHRAYPHIPFYLSAGTDQDPRGELDLLETTSARYRWLCESVAGEPELHRAVGSSPSSTSSPGEAGWACDAAPDVPLRSGVPA